MDPLYRNLYRARDKLTDRTYVCAYAALAHFHNRYHWSGSLYVQRRTQLEVIQQALKDDLYGYHQPNNRSWVLVKRDNSIPEEL